MIEIQKIRIQNLKKLLDKHGGATALGKASGKESSYFSHLLSGRRKMGNKFCRGLEASLELKEGWMDTSH